MVFWGLVLARSSSKSIVDKNIKILGNKPLIGWVLESMKSSEIFDEIWVSTDDHRIESIALSYEVKVHRRSEGCSTDSASSLSAILEFLETNKGSEQICLVQITSPFLQPIYLKKAHNLMTQLKYDSIFSVYRSHSLRWSPDLKPLNLNPKSRPRRQEWTGEFVESGHFYCFSTELIKNYGLIQGGKCGVVEIPKQFCLEIDDTFDWDLAQIYVKYLNKSCVVGEGEG